MSTVTSRPALPGRNMSASQQASPLTPHTPSFTGDEPDPLLELLCNADNGLDTMLERAKQTVFSCKDMLTFLRKRAAIEEEYGRAMLKLISTSRETTERPDRKQHSYGEAMQSVFKVHETIGQNHVKLSSTISDIAEGLQSLLKDTDRARKSLREMGLKFYRGLLEAEASVDKARSKYDACCEEWERTLAQRNGEVLSPVRKPGSSNPLSRFKQRTPHSLNRSEEDARIRVDAANDNYKAQLALANAVRHDYYHSNMPLVLQALLEALEECDYGMQYYLAKYAFNTESLQLLDATAVSPSDRKAIGLRSQVDTINHQKDLQAYIMKFHAKDIGRKRREDIPYEEYPFSEQARSIVNPRPIFGVDLALQLKRDNMDIPPILSKCATSIEKHGIKSEGIYRISGPVSQLRQLKAAFDKDNELVLLGEKEPLYDIHAIAGVLKQYLRELPEPLLTRALSEEFIQAAGEENTKRLGECVKKMPVSNMKVLNYLIAHLCRIRDYEALNRMGANNLSIIFGPTVTCGNESLNPMVDMARRCKVIE
ncbi:Rho GTPase activation protein [Syncephalis plumigaleata]|nr:Rho GTPase activation protein [Syncephalis plumigaleata]